MSGMGIELERLGESALVVRLGDVIDEALNARIHALNASIGDARLPALSDRVPAYASLLLRFDPVEMRQQGVTLDTLAGQVRTLADALTPSDGGVSGHARTHSIRVCYDSRHAPDLDAVAQASGLTADEVVQRHHAREYRVAMIGFAPGFPYLLGMDPALAVPRRAQPRTRVPAGSVAIGGAQTGIYPRELPGGWQLIGRTPDRLFDADNRNRPCLLEPGDRVRFEPIDEARFSRLAEGQGT